MTFRSLPAVLAATVALGSMGMSSFAATQDQAPVAPPAVAAHDAPLPPGYCAEQSDHTGATVVGGLAGAAIGSNLAAHHGGRVGGALLGGLVGAIIGHRVGEEHSPPPPGCRGYYRSGYAYGYGYPHYYYPHRYHHYYGYYGPRYVYGGPPVVVEEYGPPPPPPPPPGYVDAPRASGGECKTVQSNVQMPDGGSQTRDVRVCKDGSGRYQVVD